MKNILSKEINFKSIEFWAATTIFVFLVFFHISDALWSSRVVNQTADGSRMPFNYLFISQLIKFILLYVAFLLLNFTIIPKLIQRESLFFNILLSLLVFVIIGLLFATIETYLKYNLVSSQLYDKANHTIVFQKNLLYAAWLLLVFGFYTVIKYLGLFLLSRSEEIQAQYKFITPAALVAFTIWMISMFLLLVFNTERIFNAFWAIVIPSGILFYMYSFHSLIPKSFTKKKPFRSYLGKTFITLLISFLPIWVIGMALAQHDEGGLVIGFFNSAIHLFITAPLCWIIFKRQMQGREEIYSLQKELGRSHANFDFLRSQINPHFLFNALNTIYGTAIQEKAERTSEGIERLGDMMRFMLQENMQEKIPLSREIEYLNNYISLQKLRTDPNPSIKIEADIEMQAGIIQIAPMLLIPFVENAFKHGISFREPSYISVTLEVKEKTLFFDVHNSKHLKVDNDPEKGKSGIGLDNVKQRLQLLYPAKHELIVRETAKDFFIHLTLQVS